jgi:hypothetical protein
VTSIVCSLRSSSTFKLQTLSRTNLSKLIAIVERHYLLAVVLGRGLDCSRCSVLYADFAILFFTETLFFVGASVFLYIAHICGTQAAAASQQWKSASSFYSLGYRLSAKIVLGTAVLLPVATFVMVWPWTGPAAAAALAPYMIGLLVQIGFEHIIHANSSPVWPLVPVTFQVCFSTGRGTILFNVQMKLCRYFLLSERDLMCSPFGSRKLVWFGLTEAIFT